MSTSSTTPQTTIPGAQQQDIDRTLTYWFTGENISEKWFRAPDQDALDLEIREQFEPLVLQARNHSLNTWTSTPDGSLALLILLDQFPRNIYRGTPAGHASDEQAYDLAVSSIAKGFDRAPKLTDFQASFFYLPLMHAESLVAQIACISLMEALWKRCVPESPEAEFMRSSLGHAKGHMDVIRRFGRFPSRNEILGRESTPEEKDWLKERPGGF